MYIAVEHKVGKLTEKPYMYSFRNEIMLFKNLVFFIMLHFWKFSALTMFHGGSYSIACSLCFLSGAKYK